MSKVSDEGRGGVKTSVKSSRDITVHLQLGNDLHPFQNVGVLIPKRFQVYFILTKTCGTVIQ